MNIVMALEGNRSSTSLCGKKPKFTLNMVVLKVNGVPSFTLDGSIYNIYCTLVFGNTF